MKDGENLPLQLKRVVKSGIALKAIHHAISRVKQFNNQNNHFPVEIRSVGIGGSSIRSEDPNDIDLFVEAHAIKNIWPEWCKFRGMLNSNAYGLNKIALDLRKREGKLTISRMIEADKDELLALGFEELWIKNWFKWLRSSDIRGGDPLVYFSEYQLIPRFIKNGWRGKRLEVHISSFDLRGKRITRDEWQRVIIWKKKKRTEKIEIPNEKDVHEHLQNEYKKLLDISKKIIKTVKSEKARGIPVGHRCAKDAVFLGIPTGYSRAILIAGEREGGEPFKNPQAEFERLVRIEFRKLALSELDAIEKLIETGPKKLIETNTKLNGHLKRFTLIGPVSKRIENIDYYDLLNADDVYMTLSQIIPPRLSRGVYPKKNIVELIRAVNWGKLVRDLKRRERGEVRR